MKKWLMTPLLAASACAACCTLPLLPSLLAGLLTTSLGTALTGWQPGVGLGMGFASVLALGALVWALSRSRQHRLYRLSSNQDYADTCATPPDRHACGCRAGQVETSHACE